MTLRTLQWFIHPSKKKIFLFTCKPDVTYGIYLSAAENKSVVIKGVKLLNGRNCN